MSNYEEIIPEVFESKHHMKTNCKIYSINNVLVPMFIKNLTNIPSYIEGEITHTVSEGEKNRLDNISWKYYKTPELFWVIASINNILNPMEIKEGTVLRIIPKSYIEYNILRYNEEEV